MRLRAKVDKNHGEIALKPSHVDILRHSLGLSRYGEGVAYRNHYVAGPECDKFNECRELVALGLMRDRGQQELFGGMHCFQVTSTGVQAARSADPQPPRLSRSQRRYLEFLSADSGLKFGEWLKRKHEIQG